MKKDFFDKNTVYSPLAGKTVGNIIGEVLGATTAKFIKGFVYAAGAIVAIKCFL